MSPQKHIARVATITWANVSTVYAAARNTPALLAAEAEQLLGGDTQREHFLVVALDVRHKIVGWYRVGIGSMDSCLVHPRDVFRFAILANAHSIALVHNHPSGDPTPSSDDIYLHTRLVEVGRQLGIQVVDSIVVGFPGMFYSFREKGHV